MTESTVPEAALAEDRFRLYRSPDRARRDDFADDVRTGLGAHPKHLLPKYFYDELGSALFEAICALPEYYLTRAETEILERYAPEMVGALGGPIELVEFGSGSARKTRLLIEAAIAAQSEVVYRPIDISPTALVGSARALVAEYPSLTVAAYASDYESLLAARGLHIGGRVLALFLGSNIGNFEPDAARALLVAMRGAFSPGDGLLLGYDLKKDAIVLERAYNDAAGVTSAFDKNVLGRVNRELGGTFDLDDFRHVARYDAGRGSVDSFLVSQRSHTVSIEALETTVRFSTFEAIHTESSHKFDARDVEALAAHAGMRVERTWFDDGRRFAVSLLVVRAA